MWIQRHAITIMFNRTTIFNQNHTCLKVDPISLKVNPLQYLWSQKGERTSMRTMELKCIHQNTLSTCAGKDHCQGMQKQNRKRSVSWFGLFWLVVFLFFCCACICRYTQGKCILPFAIWLSGLLISDAPLFCILLMWGQQCVYPNTSCCSGNACKILLLIVVAYRLRCAFSYPSAAFSLK